MMPCAPRMAGCKASCLHRALVQSYKDERIRQEDVAEQLSLGYQTEFREYIASHPLITFKEWLVGNRKQHAQEVAA